MNLKFLNHITDFIFVQDEPEPADIIFLPGNGYPQMAILAARLWQQNYASYILISGKYAKHSGVFQSILRQEDRYFDTYATEYDFLYAVLVGEGVTPQSILVEKEATFTYENAVYSRKLTDQLNLQVNKAILCCHAYHARRCLMYYQLLYPEAKFLVCPADTGIHRSNWYLTEEGIKKVLGEVERCGSQFHEIIKGMR